MISKTLGRSILFQFLNAQSNNDKGMFVETTKGGIQLRANSDDSSKKPRWGLITHIGDDVGSVEVGNYILIEPLMWTEGVEHEGEKYWKTIEDKVLLVSDVEPDASYYLT